MRPIVSAVNDDGVIRNAEIVEALQDRADGVVVFDHAVDVLAVAMLVTAAMSRRERACASACAWH